MAKTIAALASLITGQQLDEQINNITRDYESTFRRMSKLRTFLANKENKTYNVYRASIPAGDTVEVQAYGNVIMILLGTNLELSFNDREDFFPWDAGDPIDDFPYYKYKVKNTGVTQDVIILSLVRGKT